MHCIQHKHITIRLNCSYEVYSGITRNVCNEKHLNKKAVVNRLMGRTHLKNELGEMERAWKTEEVVGSHKVTYTEWHLSLKR